MSSYIAERELHKTANVDVCHCSYTTDKVKDSIYTLMTACAGKLSHIHSWLHLLFQLGPAYGYFAEPTKHFLVVAKQYMEEVTLHFKNI